MKGQKHHFVLLIGDGPNPLSFPTLQFLKASLEKSVSFGDQTYIVLNPLSAYSWLELGIFESQYRMCKMGMITSILQGFYKG